MVKTRGGEIRLLSVGGARIKAELATIDPSASVIFAAALFLTLESEKPVSRAVLSGLLWPTVSPSVRLHRLRQTLLKLRRIGFLVESRGKSHIALANETIHLEHLDFDPEKEMRKSNSIHSLTPLAGFEPSFSNEYEDWVERKRLEITSVLVRKIVDAVRRYRDMADWKHVERLSTSVLELSPLNEEGTLALAEALAMRGDKVAALKLLDSYMLDTGNTTKDIRVQVTLLRKRVADRIDSQGRQTEASPGIFGRADIMARINKHTRSCKSGKTEAFLLVGEAGIGKSRILAEAAKFSALQGLIPLRVTCRPGNSNQPLSTFVQLVPQLRKLPGAIGCSPETLQLLDRLTRHEPATSDSRVNSYELAWVFSGIQRALFDMIEAVGDEAPLFIQIEDIHWMDLASVELLREMLEECRSPVLFGLSARQLPAAWVAKLPSRLTPISLSPLNKEDSANLLQAVARRIERPMDGPYIDWCVRVAEGNPFFLIELANHWVETGLEHSVPDSLASLLANRLSRLDRKSLQLLQTCALLENNSTLGRLEATLEYGAFELLDSIETLGNSGMIVIDAVSEANEQRIASKHELLSRAAVDQLSEPARRYLHRRIGLVLEREIDATYSAATLWDCAKHWQLAGDTARGFRLVTSCARYLLNVGLPTEASEAYTKSLAFCTSDLQRLDVLKAQTSAYFCMSAWPSVTERCNQIRSFQERIQPGTSRHDFVELMELRAQWQSSDWATVLEKAKACLATTTADGDHRAEAGVMALMLSGMQCNRQESDRIYFELETLFAAGGVRLATQLKARMVYHIDFGNIEEGIANALSLVEEQRANGSIGDIYQDTLNAAMAFRCAGDFDKAASLYTDALELATTHRLQFALQRGLVFSAHMALERGRVEEARDLAKRLNEIPISTSDRLLYIQKQAIDIRLALCDGRTDDAASLLSISIDEIANDPIFSKRTYNLALVVAVELATKGTPSLNATRLLEASFQKSKRTQNQAFSAFVLYVALRQLGRQREAEKLLDEYEGVVRREPWPAPRHLLRSIENVVPRKTRSRSGRPKRGRAKLN